MTLTEEITLSGEQNIILRIEMSTQKKIIISELHLLITTPSQFQQFCYFLIEL